MRIAHSPYKSASQEIDLKLGIIRSNLLINFTARAAYLIIARHLPNSHRILDIAGDLSIKATTSRLEMLGNYEMIFPLYDPSKEFAYFKERHGI